ncbi:MAG: apolipoprotein N-acyltransferase, partial [Acidimicrobiia bacterium]
VWLLFGAGSWAAMELFRYYIPFNGFEWGALGYGLADQGWARDLSAWIGVSGLTVVVFLTSGALAIGFRRRRWRMPSLVWGIAVAIVVLAVTVNAVTTPETVGGTEVAIVQGSTPCPFEHCPPNERLRTFQQHLELTKGITPGSVDLVVWSEGSTGSINADPVLNPEVGEAISAEARRIGAWILVGSDRPISVTEWINANVLIDRTGTFVGEYRKQHPVPFGEYIPFRPLFEWIPALDQVPRDMIPGDGPVVWDTDFDGRLGSVISFEGSFSRYARQHVAAGAEVVVVATNEGSYGTTPASDQLIGMTRMRAAELGVPVIHAAVTGKSTFIDRNGVFDEITGLGTQEVLYGTFFPGTRTLYSRIGDMVMVFAALTAAFLWWQKRALVGSKGLNLEED